MAGYQIVASLTDYLLRVLRQAVCPALLPHPEQVAAQPPDAKERETLLGLHLYDLSICVDYAFDTPQGRRTALEAGYLLYLSRHAQSPLDVLAEHQVLARVLEAICACPAVEPALLEAGAGAWEEPVSLAVLKLEQRRKEELWNSMGEPLRPAVYLRAAPLLVGGAPLDAERVRSMRGEVVPR